MILTGTRLKIQYNGATHPRPANGQCEHVGMFRTRGKQSVEFLLVKRAAMPAFSIINDNPSEEEVRHRRRIIGGADPA